MGRKRDYAPWTMLGKPLLGRLKVLNIEKACPSIYSCIKEWTGKMGYEYPRDFFHRDIGCFSCWKDCLDLGVMNESR